MAHLTKGHLLVLFLTHGQWDCDGMGKLKEMFSFLPKHILSHKSNPYPLSSLAFRTSGYHGTIMSKMTCL